jgi:hypothetical protein
MKIASIRTIGVRGLADVALSLVDEHGLPHDRVLICGPSASGKSRLLELVVAVREMVAPTGELIDEDPFVRLGNSTARAVVELWLGEAERAALGRADPLIQADVVFGSDVAQEPDPALAFVLGRYAHDDETPKLEYFSERRRLDVGGGDMALDEEHQRAFRSSGDVRKLAFVPKLLAELAKHPERARRFARGVAGLSRALRYDVERHVLLSADRKVDDLRELSASEADAVSFAATAALVGLSHSIVLVDRPELHGLDPVRALEGICALGQDNQVIAATSAPELYRGFQGSVVTLDGAATRL